MSIGTAQSTYASGLPERKRRLHDFLSSHPTGVLSTTTPNSDPHGAVIYFVLDSDFTMYFLTKKETRKRDNLVHNDHCTLTVYDVPTQTTAEITGQATECTNADEINEIAARIYEASLQLPGPGLPPITKLEAGEYTAFAITPMQIRIAVYARPDPGYYDDLFESFESFELIDN